MKLLLENGTIKSKFIRPKGGRIKIDKEKSIDFDNRKVYREGFFPTTVVRLSDLLQVDIEENVNHEEVVKADIGVRLWNDGFIQGFKRARIQNNLFFIMLVGMLIIGLVCILTYGNSTKILEILKSMRG